MTPRRIGLGLLLAIAAIALTYAWRTRPRVTPARAGTALAVAQSVHAPATNPHAAMTRGAMQPPLVTPVSTYSPDNDNEAPLPSGPFSVIGPQLEARALAGDKRAAKRLFDIYRLCRARTPDGDAAPSKLHTPKYLRSPTITDPLFKPVTSAAIKDVYAGWRASMANLCDGLGPMPPVNDHWSEYWRWLAIAARNGDTGAMITYALYVVPTYPEVEGRKRDKQVSALGHAEDIARYRDQAVGYLERAFELGANRALVVYAREYASGSLFELDQVRATAYVLAWRNSDAMDSPNNRVRSWVILKYQEQKRLSAAQLAQARALAAQIEARFDAHQPPPEAN